MGSDGSVAQYYPLTDRQKRYQKIKRAMDFVLALLALLVLALPLLAVALLQKLTSPHEPVLFRQERVGQNGERFTIVKFRSMEDGAQGQISRFGRFLRDTSIDELPQLCQVLTGKMSLVGPRPLVPQEEEIHQMRRDSGVYQLRPGLTGLAQINGRDKLGAAEKAAYDRQYLEGMSLVLDMKILWITIRKVLTCADV